MKIIVFDVPAENGGALTILEQYYEKARKEKDISWVFVLSTPKLENKENIKVLNYPWIKKSWLHRLYFDKIIAPKIVKDYKADEVLSLQNIIVPRINIPQTLYLHQPLPFVEKRYRITENFIFWLYQNLISKLIFSSIKKADKIIVQTEWMLESAMQKAGVGRDKFQLEQPKLIIPVQNVFKSQKKETLFFYPASALEYKNHRIIIEACRKIKCISTKPYKIILTLSGNENDYINKLYQIVIKEELPIEFIGAIDRDEVYEYYSKSILLFPSYIETFGLPLLEASVHQCPILASNCAFSTEILAYYNNVDFFDPFDDRELSDLIVSKIN